MSFDSVKPYWYVTSTTRLHLHKNLQGFQLMIAISKLPQGFSGNLGSNVGGRPPGPPQLLRHFQPVTHEPSRTDFWVLADGKPPTRRLLPTCFIYTREPLQEDLFGQKRNLDLHGFTGRLSTFVDILRDFPFWTICFLPSVSTSTPKPLGKRAACCSACCGVSSVPQRSIQSEVHQWEVKIFIHIKPLPPPYL